MEKEIKFYLKIEEEKGTRTNKNDKQPEYKNLTINDLKENIAKKIDLYACIENSFNIGFGIPLYNGDYRSKLQTLKFLCNILYIDNLEKENDEPLPVHEELVDISVIFQLFRSMSFNDKLKDYDYNIDFNIFKKFCDGGDICWCLFPLQNFFNYETFTKEIIQNSFDTILVFINKSLYHVYNADKFYATFLNRLIDLNCKDEIIQLIKKSDSSSRYYFLTAVVGMKEKFFNLFTESEINKFIVTPLKSKIKTSSNYYLLDKLLEVFSDYIDVNKDFDTAKILYLKLFTAYELEKYNIQVPISPSSSDFKFLTDENNLLVVCYLNLASTEKIKTINNYITFDIVRRMKKDAKKFLNDFVNLDNEENCELVLESVIKYILDDGKKDSLSLLYFLCNKTENYKFLNGKTFQTKINEIIYNNEFNLTKYKKFTIKEHLKNN